GLGIVGSRVAAGEGEDNAKQGCQLHRCDTPRRNVKEFAANGGGRLPIVGRKVFSEAMASLSNLFGHRDDRHDRDRAGPSSIVPAGAEILCRRVQRAEIEPALRLILGTETGLASDEQVLDFLAFAIERKIDVNEIRVSMKHG